MSAACKSLFFTHSTCCYCKAETLCFCFMCLQQCNIQVSWQKKKKHYEWIMQCLWKYYTSHSIGQSRSHSQAQYLWSWEIQSPQEQGVAKPRRKGYGYVFIESFGYLLNWVISLIKINFNEIIMDMLKDIPTQIFFFFCLNFSNLVY